MIPSSMPMRKSSRPLQDEIEPGAAFWTRNVGKGAVLYRKPQFTLDARPFYPIYLD
jgi:hypothetical protein